MFEVKIHELGAAEEKDLTRVVCVAKYEDKWVFCKHKDRDTWELPGGHIEDCETWLETARREMFEETGALVIEAKPVCLYSVSSYGMLCYVEIKKLGKISMFFEMEKMELFDELPKELTYPESHTLLFETVKNYLNNNN